MSGQRRKTFIPGGFEDLIGELAIQAHQIHFVAAPAHSSQQYVGPVYPTRKDDPDIARWINDRLADGTD